MEHEHLRCVDDSSPLSEQNGRLQCSQCGASYRERAEDVIDFVGEQDYYWGEVTSEQMDRILDYARIYGYEEAIDDLLGAEIDESYRSSLREPTRIDWRLLLGFSDKDVVVDVGSGWGRLGFALAPWVNRLYSLEYVESRLEFQKIMREQRRDENIELIRGSFLDLPFAKDAVDWVVFNGVFEWVGLAGKDDCEKMQRQVLDQSFSAVKPGGKVMIAIENRWGINTFFGAIDHSGLPYTNLMPRSVADWWVRRKNLKHRNDTQNDGYRTYTYGLPGYVGLLRDMGADNIQVYALLPHYNIPRAIVPIYPSTSVSAQIYAANEIWQRPTPSAAIARFMTNVATRVGLMKYVYPHYLAVGQKPC